KACSEYIHKIHVETYNRKVMSFHNRIDSFHRKLVDFSLHMKRLSNTGTVQYFCSVQYTVSKKQNKLYHHSIPIWLLKKHTYSNIYVTFVCLDYNSGDNV